MKEYKWAKIFIIATAALTCLIVLLTFGLSYFKGAKVVRPAALITKELVQNATSISVEYKGESVTFKKADEIKRIYIEDKTVGEIKVNVKGKVIYINI